MASTTALFTGLSGLTANARNLDVIGNNIANVNTTAFKSSRMLFSDAFPRTFSIGSPPNENTGGTNPGQIGLGVTIAGTQRDFSSGALSPTGDPRDLAIEGDGLFVVNRDGQPFYTRAGAFRQNAQNQLVTISGERVQGFGVDGQFNIVPGRLTDLAIPVGTLTLAEATRNVNFAGNLNAGGALPTTGSNIAMSPFSLLTGPIGGPGGNLLETNSLLSQISDPTAPGSPLFQPGQAIQLTGAEKGSRVLPDASFDITAGSTVQNLIDFLNRALGIVTTTGPNPNGQTPGVQLNPATGVLNIIGNTGAANDLDLEAQDLRLLDAAGATVRQPFTPSKTAAADGESVRTTFVAFDSLGNPVSADLTVVLDATTAGGTQWRFFVESGDDTDLDLEVGTGLINFDTTGQLISPESTDVQINRAGTGAADPLTLTLNFASASDRLSALADGPSQIAATFQDGAPLGVLASFAVAPDGLITGAFTNGLTRTVGQVALATFANPEGLVSVGSNLFTVGPNSGTPVVTAPQSLGAGRIVGGSLELSNVDLSQEFINLILASTGFSASSRVITTTDQLMQQLLVLGR